MENPYDPNVRGSSYELSERRPSNGLPSVESAQVNSSNNPPLKAASADHLRRRLKGRHVQMIAIAGTMGTGLFLSSGEAIKQGGPLGALMAFALVGSVAYASLCSLGEMTSLAPISGTFPYFASRWVDPALGFAVGWNYFLTNALYVPAEIAGARLLITFWDTGHTLLYTLIICLVMCSTNIFGVVYFAETEFAFSIIKLIMITGLIIVGLLIDLGGLPNAQPPIGFDYWKDPGPFIAANSTTALAPEDPSLDNFIGILSVIVQAAFAYQGMEIVAIAASETKNPRRNITKAIRRVFYRVLIFYILGIFVAGLIVPSNDQHLLGASSSTGTATQSPFVIAIQNAKIKALPAIVTAGMITSAFSAGNSFLFCSSRILYGLALRKQAPSILTYCTRKGLPIVAVLCSSAFAFLSLIDLRSEDVFNKFMQLSTIGGFFGWLSINLTYLFFYRGLCAQSIDRSNLYYRNSLQPWLSIWGLVWCIFFILINGFRVFWPSNWKVSDFVISYVDILIFFVLFLFWKITQRTEVWKPDEMDFTTGIPTYEETEIDEIPPKGFWEHVSAALF